MSDAVGHGGNILSAGNYKLESFYIYSLTNGAKVNLRNLFQKVEIFEDLFSPYITAKVYIEDGFNFPERLPIKGQEKVELVFKTDVDSLPLVELVFRVYKLDSGRISQNGKSQEYVLHLMSEGGYFNFSQYCGYAVNGTVSSMVSSIFRKHFPPSVWENRLDIENTKDNYSFVLSGAYTPFKAINWLTSRAHSQMGNNYSPFMFYETVNGHCFRSFSSIIERGSSDPTTYVYTIPNAGIAEGEKQSLGFNSILPNRYHKIQSFEELNRFDSAKNIFDGVVAARLGVHDLLRKDLRFSRFEETDVFDTMKKLGDFSRLNKGDSTLESILQKNGAYFYMPNTAYTVWDKGNKIVDNFNTESLFLKRRYHMNTFLTQKIVIDIFGDSRKKIGDVVKIKIPKPQSDTVVLDDKDDKNLSGEYLVTGVRHTLGTSYRCKMELSRNGMGV